MSKTICTVLMLGYNGSNSRNDGGNGGSTKIIEVNEEAIRHFDTANRALKTFVTAAPKGESVNSTAVCVEMAQGELNQLQDDWSQGRLTGEKAREYTKKIDSYLENVQETLEGQPKNFSDSQVAKIEETVKALGLAAKEMPGFQIPDNSAPQLRVEYALETSPDTIRSAKVMASAVSLRHAFNSFRCYWAVTGQGARTQITKAAIRELVHAS